jgi:hypothetical protein
MQMLKSAGDMRFYTIGKYRGAYGNSPELSNTLFKDVAATDKIDSPNFKLKIMAFAGKTHLIADCENCEMVQSIIMSSPAGTIQCVEIKYSDMDMIWS